MFFLAFIVFTVLISPVFVSAPTQVIGSYEITYNLISNTEQCLVECSLKFNFSLNDSFTIPDSSYFYEKFVNMTGYDLRESGFKMRENITYNVSVPEYGICQNIFPNETNTTQTCEEQGFFTYNSTHCYLNETCITGYYNETRWKHQWNEFNPVGFTFEANKWYTIELYGKKQAKLGRNDMDAIPVILGHELPFAWWNSSWNYRRNVTLTENAGLNLTDYPVIYWFEHGGNANFDCSDIRILNETGEEIPFGLRNCNSTHVELVNRFKNVSASSTKNYTVYYGNPDAIFVNITWNDVEWNFWDDFSDNNIDTNKWKDWCADWMTEVNGYLEMACTHESCVQLLDGSGNNLTLSNTKADYKILWVNTSYFESAIWTRNAWGSGIDGAEAIGGYRYGEFSSYIPANYFAFTSSVGYTPVTGVWYHIIANVTNDTWKSMETVSGSYLSGTDAGQVNNTQFWIKFRSVLPVYVRFDDVYIKEWVDPEPTITLGSEEALSSVNLNLPSDNVYNSSATIYFQFTPSYSDTDFQNASIWTNETGTFQSEELNTSAVSNGTINTIAHTFTAEGTFIWNAEVCLPNECRKADSNRTITIDWTAPSISATRDSSNGCELPCGMNYTFTITDSSFDFFNLTVYNPDYTVLEIKNYTNTQGVYNVSLLLTNQTGNYTVEINATDKALNNKIENVSWFGVGKTSISYEYHDYNFTDSSNSLGETSTLTNNTYSTIWMNISVIHTVEGILIDVKKENKYNLTDNGFTYNTIIGIYNRTGDGLTYLESNGNVTWNTSSYSNGDSPFSNSIIVEILNAQRYTYHKSGTTYLYAFQIYNISKTFWNYVTVALHPDQYFSSSLNHPRYEICLSGIDVEGLTCSSWSNTVDVYQSNEYNNEISGYKINMASLGGATMDKLEFNSTHSDFLMRLTIESGAYTTTEAGGGGGGGLIIQEPEVIQEVVEEVTAKIEEIPAVNLLLALILLGSLYIIYSWSKKKRPDEFESAIRKYLGLKKRR